MELTGVWGADKGELRKSDLCASAGDLYRQPSTGRLQRDSGYGVCVAKGDFEWRLKE